MAQSLQFVPAFGRSDQIDQRRWVQGNLRASVHEEVSALQRIVLCVRTIARPAEPFDSHVSECHLNPLSCHRLKSGPAYDARGEPDTEISQHCRSA